MKFKEFKIETRTFQFMEKSFLDTKEGLDSLQERGTLLYLFAKISNAKVIIETGTSNGFSSTCLSNAMKDNNIQGEIHTFDCYEWGSEYSSKENAKESIKLNKAEDIIVQHIGNSIELLPKVLDSLSEKVDFVHIDSEHDYNTPKKEFALIEPYLNDKSYIFFHDTDIQSVEQAVNDILIDRKGIYQKIILPLHSEMTILQKV